jgi:hypothetical protein
MRPDSGPLDIERIRDTWGEIATHERWVVWGKGFKVEKDGTRKVSKVPHSPQGTHAPEACLKADIIDCTHEGAASGSTVAYSTTWRNVATAVRFADQSKGFRGIGVVIPAGYVCVDLDHATSVPHGTVEPWALDIIERLDAFTEWSPSGTGLHVWFKGTKPGTACRKAVANGGQIEMYEGPHGRYITVTGGGFGRWGDLPIREVDPEALAWVYALLETPRPRRDTIEAASVSRRSSTTLSDDDIINAIKASKAGRDIEALMNGDASALADYGDDQSRAEFGLARRLAWWFDGDAAAIERVMNATALCNRPKWHDRPKYRTDTIMEAVADHVPGDCYSPSTTGSTRTAPPAASVSTAAVEVVGSPTAAGVAVEAVEYGFISRTLDTYPMEHVEWLWHQWLPAGTLTVLDGDPRLGKSTITLDIAARLTTGSKMPDGTLGSTYKKPVPVIMAGVEDGVGKTIAVRVGAAGGDPKLVHNAEAVRVPGRPTKDGTATCVVEEFTLPDHLDDLEALVTRTGARLVIIDNLMNLFSSRINSNSDQDVRRVLRPLSALADRTGCAVLVVRHLSKGVGSNHLYRGGGSIGIIGAARMGWAVGFDPEDEHPVMAERRRVLAVTKSNLDKEPTSMAYGIVTAYVPNGEGVAPFKTSAIEWLGASNLTAEALLRNVPDAPSKRGGGALGKARAWLREHLGDGIERRQREIEEMATEEGISERTLRRAMKDLDIKARAVGGGKDRAWWWSLPPADERAKPVAPRRVEATNWYATDGLDDPTIEPVVDADAATRVVVADMPDHLERAALEWRDKPNAGTLADTPEAVVDAVDIGDIGEAGTPPPDAMQVERAEPLRPKATNAKAMQRPLDILDGIRIDT